MYGIVSSRAPVTPRLAFELEARVCVTNTGRLDGDEAVQLYLSRSLVLPPGCWLALPCRLPLTQLRQPATSCFRRRWMPMWPSSLPCAWSSTKWKSALGYDGAFAL